MPTLASIEKMDLDNLQHLWRNLTWSRAWSGQLNHAWYDSRDTLCDKHLVPHGHRSGRYFAANRPCLICYRRCKAIRDRMKTLNQDA